MSGRRLFMMVGLPRSGKSSIARRLSKAYDAPIVSPDEIRKAIHGEEYIQSAERLVWATVHIMIKALFLAGHDNVVLDACNNTYHRREEFKNDELWTRIFYVVNTPMDICLQRAEGNIRLQHAICYKASLFESVDHTEGDCIYVE